MNTKKLAVSFIAVYIVNQILGYLIHQVWLSPTYASMPEVWRPEADMMSKMWIMFITAAIWCLCFCYIYARGCEGKGIGEGVRYGALIGVFYSLTLSYDSYVIYPLPYDLALKWFFSGMVISIVCGIVVALTYKPEEA